MMFNTNENLQEASSELYKYFKSNKPSFIQILNITRNDLIMVLNLVVTLSVQPDEFDSLIVNDVLCDEFFDKLVNFLQHLNTFVNDEFRTLVKFYEVIVHHLPLCDIAYSKISGLLHMTYDYMNKKASGIFEPYLQDRIEELLQLVGGRKYLKCRSDFSYTDIELFPSPADFYETRVLKPSIIDGPYENSEQYLDIQFKLLREDYFCGVREFLKPFKSQTVRGELKNYLYKNVKSKRLFLSQNASSKIRHRVVFSKKDELLLGKEDWTRCKKFMNGSLLFFTQNNFVSFFVATVEENLILLTGGNVIGITVSVVGNPYQLKIDSYYDMIEPKLFFEPYYQALKVLQNMNPYDFPLANDILTLSNEIVPSAFVSSSPSGYFNYEGTDLNKSQVEALNAALSHKFTLIQGPPGTGKSHLTRKLIQIFIEDTTDTRPVLVICMRNRALDNILEPLAKSGVCILRFGWTENEILENYSFHEWKKRCAKNKKLNARFLRKNISLLRKIINDKQNINNPPAVEDASELHNTACAAYRLLSDYYYGKMFLKKNVKLIGATITGAAKRNRMISEMKPKAVIIEEAAEILEPYLIASLPRPCDHLILVGDHLQLQPITSWNNSAVKYNLNVSLFERLIKNGKGYHRLNIQHRMRPEIAELVCPLIYDDLMNDSSVYKLSDILGVAKNVFFLTHSYNEQFLVESSSYTNQNEAMLLLSFANYFIKQGYSSNEITILAAYSAQQNYLIKNSAKYPSIEGMQIQSIDNYQGDENEIILLSLVRSNGHSIGFLRQANRLNVALSRAKAGFYMMGNADTLSSYSELWGDIFHILNQRNCIGEALPLKCKIHQKITCVSKPEEINNLKLGGCKSRCDFKKECGHVCDKQCHASLSFHDQAWCNKQCLRKPCGSHRCRKQCNQECEPCTKKINVSLKCGHNIELECSSKPSNVQCTKPCNRNSCDRHKCNKLCYEDCSPCKEWSTYRLQCGHYVTLQCSIDVRYYVCKLPCDRSSCGVHKCRYDCSLKPCPPCPIPIRKRRECGHSYIQACGEPEDTFCDETVLFNYGKCHHFFEVPCYTTQISREPDKCQNCKKNEGCLIL